MSRGRPEQDRKKGLVEDALALRISFFSREGYLRPDPGTAYRSILRWTSTRTGQERGSLQWTTTAAQVTLRYGDPPGDYPIQVVYTPLARGGRRAWWACPECRRRCAVLYAPYGRHPFACRICHNLTYYSQQSRYGARDLETRLRRFAVGRLILGEAAHQPAGGQTALASMATAPQPRRGRPRMKRTYTRRQPV